MLNIQLKRLGKKKVKHLEYPIKKLPKTLHELIEACVKSEVKRYNEKRENVSLLSFLTPQNLQEQSEKGKITFGDIENKTLAVEENAIANALQGFQDGLFVVFIEEEEIKNIDQQLRLSSNSVIVFIRMTFLSGTYW